MVGAGEPAGVWVEEPDSAAVGLIASEAALDALLLRLNRRVLLLGTRGASGFMQNEGDQEWSNKQHRQRRSPLLCTTSCIVPGWLNHSPIDQFSQLVV